MGELEMVCKGKWIATANYEVDSSGERRVSRLVIQSSDCPPKTALAGAEAPFVVGVDSGHAGFFDSSHYPGLVAPTDDTNDWYDLCCYAAKSPKQAGVIAFGVVTVSGFGDGSYRCIQYKDDRGLVMMAELVFIEAYEH